MSRIKLEILFDDRRWKGIPRLSVRLARAANALVAHLPRPLGQPLAVTVLLTHDRRIKALNREYLGINRPTNVLAFPQFANGKLTIKSKTRSMLFAGDVILGYQYIVGEAKKDHKILINHAIHLLIHGILHILGYDHISSADALRMERLESRIMADLCLPDPYAPQPREPKAR